MPCGRSDQSTDEQPFPSLPSLASPLALSAPSSRSSCAFTLFSRLLTDRLTCGFRFLQSGFECFLPSALNRRARYLNAKLRNRDTFAENRHHGRSGQASIRPIALNAVDAGIDRVGDGAEQLAPSQRCPTRHGG